MAQWIEIQDRNSTVSVTSEDLDRALGHAIAYVAATGKNHDEVAIMDIAVSFAYFMEAGHVPEELRSAQEQPTKVGA